MDQETIFLHVVMLLPSRRRRHHQRSVHRARTHTDTSTAVQESKCCGSFLCATESIIIIVVMQLHNVEAEENPLTGPFARSLSATPTRPAHRGRGWRNYYGALSWEGERARAE